MKILYVITGLGGGGAEKVVADLADKMYERGHEVKIAFLKGNVIVKPKNNNIEIIPLGLEGLINFYTSSIKFRILINNFRPDVVHAHMVHANIFARLARIFSPIPKLICTAHNSNEGGKFRMLAYKLTNTLSEYDTNVSQEATQIFIRKGAFTNDALTIYNGINLNNFIFNPFARNSLANSLNISKSDKVFLSVGRLNSQKDYPNLVDAVNLLRQNININNIKFLIAGSGELQELLQKKINDLKLENSIKFLGRRDDIADLMSAADFFVLSSKFEGFGLVVAEAMACQIFVIATDCGGVKEVMGGNGILVPPQNSQALADALQQAINLSNEQKLSNNQAALKYVKQNFDLQTVIKQWIHLYEA